MSEKTKTIAELADYVRSDLPVQEIIDNFQYLIQKLDYTNRVAAITKAIERLNDGCTYDYVAAGLREWYGIDSSYMEQKGFYRVKYDINDNLQNKRKKRIKPNNLLTERDPLTRSLFPYPPKSPKNP